MAIRPTTQAAFTALQTNGEVPSTHKLHTQLGGSYPRLVQEVRELRAAAAAGVPAVLMGTPEVAEALEKLRQALRTDKRLYPRVVNFLQRLQCNKQGPLTDVLAAWVKADAP